MVASNFFYVDIQYPLVVLMMSIEYPGMVLVDTHPCRFCDNQATMKVTKDNDPESSDWWWMCKDCFSKAFPHLAPQVDEEALEQFKDSWDE